MKEFFLNMLTDWNWNAPIAPAEMRRRLAVLIPLLIVSFFVSPLMFLVAPFLLMSYHRRYLDLLGCEFYSGQRIILVWVVMFVVGMIPVLGPISYIWIMGWWERKFVKDLLARAFEGAELI